MKQLLKWTTKTRGRAMLLCLVLAAALISVSSALSGDAEAKQSVPNLKKGVINLVGTALAGFVADTPVLDNDSTTVNATALDLQGESGNALP